jgi:hypothetical protein
MAFNRVFDILGLLVVAGIITTLVTHKNTASVVNAFGGSFTGALRAAEGR